MRIWHCETQEQYDHLMKQLEAEGCRWHSGCQLTKINFWGYRKEGTYICEKQGSLLVGCKNSCERECPGAEIQPVVIPEPTPADSIRELVKQDKKAQKSLDETYIEWLRTKAAVNRRIVDENDIVSDFEKMVIQDAEMQEAIADRLEGLICSLIDGVD